MIRFAAFIFVLLQTTASFADIRSLPTPRDIAFANASQQRLQDFVAALKREADSAHVSAPEVARATSYDGAQLTITWGIDTRSGSIRWRIEISAALVPVSNELRVYFARGFICYREHEDLRVHADPTEVEACIFKKYADSREFIRVYRINHDSVRTLSDDELLRRLTNRYSRRAR